jgi:sugar/nucleoside kinase (ribokinase family)
MTDPTDPSRLGLREKVEPAGSTPHSRSILAYGTIAVDHVETPAGSAAGQLGGSAIYFAAAASVLARLWVVGVVGTDFPMTELDFLRRRDVDLSGIRVVSGSTMTWHARYSDDLENRVTLDSRPGVAAEARPVVPPAARAAPIVFLGSFDPVLQGLVLDQAHQPELVALDTMSHWIERSRRELDAVLCRSQIVFLNEAEARMLGGGKTLDEAAVGILAKGPRWVIVKLGRAGAVAFGPGAPLSVGGCTVESPVDPTGAGDAFAGGVLGALARSSRLDPDSVARALRVGNATGSLAVEGFGIDPFAGQLDAEIRRRAPDALDG